MGAMLRWRTKNGITFGVRPLPFKSGPIKFLLKAQRGPTKGTRRVLGLERGPIARRIVKLLPLGWLGWLGWLGGWWGWGGALGPAALRSLSLSLSLSKSWPIVHAGARTRLFRARACATCISQAGVSGETKAKTLSCSLRGYGTRASLLLLH